MSVERPADAVQWHEGMLLVPQHFQQADRRGEQLIAYHAAAVSPWQWGLVRLALDEPKLIAGTVRVVALEAIMPDGLAVSHFIGTETLELVLDKKEHAEELAAGTLTVHLAVEAADVGGGDGRYRSVETEPVADTNPRVRGAPVRIPRLRPRLHLFAGPTPPDKYVSLPILRLRLRDGVHDRVDFEAPCLFIGAASMLGRRISEEVLVPLRRRATELANLSRGADGGQSYDIQVLFRGLVTRLPQLEVQLSSQGASPFSLYLGLAGLAGSLAAMHGRMPPKFPDYSHHDIWACFTPLIKFTADILEAVRPLYDEIPFRWEGGRHIVELDAGDRRGRLVIGLRRPPGTDAAQAAGWMAGCRIASSEFMSRLEANRMLGATRHAIAKDDELGVRPGENMSLFSLDLAGGHIRPEGDLEIVNPADFDTEKEPYEISLFVMRTGRPDHADP